MTRQKEYTLSPDLWCDAQEAREGGGGGRENIWRGRSQVRSGQSREGKGWEGQKPNPESDWRTEWLSVGLPPRYLVHSLYLDSIFSLNARQNKGVFVLPTHSKKTWGNDPTLEDTHTRPGMEAVVPSGQYRTRGAGSPVHTHTFLISAHKDKCAGNLRPSLKYHQEGFFSISLWQFLYLGLVFSSDYFLEFCEILSRMVSLRLANLPCPQWIQGAEGHHGLHTHFRVEYCKF